MKKKLPLLLQSIALTAITNINEQAAAAEIPEFTKVTYDSEMMNRNFTNILKKPGFILKRMNSETGTYEGNFHRSHRSHSSHRSHYSSYGGSSGSSSSGYGGSSGSSSSGRSSSSGSSSSTNSFTTGTPKYSLGDRTLRFNDEGADVVQLKQLLRTLGYTIEISSLLENYFNSQTEAAVKQFQQKNNLKVDGVVSPNVLMYLKSTASPSEGLSNSYSSLSWGNTGQEVLELKKLLVRKKLLKQRDGEGLNNRFDDATEAAVKAFQLSRGLSQTGVVDRTLLQLLQQQ